jgi:hypothetical protein
MVTRDRLWLGIVLPMLLTSAAADAQLYPDLERFRGAWVPERAKCETGFFRQGSSINFHLFRCYSPPFIRGD